MITVRRNKRKRVIPLPKWYLKYAIFTIPFCVCWTAAAHWGGLPWSCLRLRSAVLLSPYHRNFSARSVSLFRTTGTASDIHLQTENQPGVIPAGFWRFACGDRRVQLRVQLCVKKLRGCIRNKGKLWNTRKAAWIQGTAPESIENPGAVFWSRVRESNPPSRLGKPMHYRCTNPALAAANCCSYSIADSFAKFNRILTAVFKV